MRISDWSSDVCSSDLAELGLDDAVELRGRVPDEELVELYQRAWVVASASSSEGWGMSLTEAAACGTPAVANHIERKSVVLGTRVSVRVDLGCRGIIKKQIRHQYDTT